MPNLFGLPSLTALTDDDIVLCGDDPSGSPTAKQITALNARNYFQVSVSSAQTASYTLVIGDAGKTVTMTVAGANNLTVPPNSSVAFPVGTIIGVEQLGAGQTTIVAGAGVTVNSRGALLNIAGQYGAVSLRKTATDVWLLAGDVS